MAEVRLDLAVSGDDLAEAIATGWEFSDVYALIEKIDEYVMDAEFTRTLKKVVNELSEE